MPGLDGFMDPIKSIMKTGQKVKSIKVKKGDTKLKVKFQKDGKNQAIKRLKGQ